MSPRIQVYKAIACRSLDGATPGIGDLKNFTLAGCGDTEVQARAAKIQACMWFFSIKAASIQAICLPSRGDYNERPQRHINGLLESTG